MIPSLIGLQLIEGCNLSCSYCYMGDLSRNHGKISFETIDGLVRQMNNSVNHYFQLSITAGEPTLAFEQFEYLVNHRYLPKNVDFSFITNATCLTPDMTRFLKKGNITVSVSIDGDRETHNIRRANSYEMMVNGVDLLKSHGIQPEISCTIGPNDYSRLSEICEHLFSINSQRINLNFELGKDWSKIYFEDQLRYLVREKRINYGQIPLASMICMDYTGTFYDCFTELDIKREKGLNLGNVREGMNKTLFYQCSTKRIYRCLNPQYPCKIRSFGTCLCYAKVSYRGLMEPSLETPGLCRLSNFLWNVDRERGTQC